MSSLQVEVDRLSSSLIRYKSQLQDIERQCEAQKNAVRSDRWYLKYHRFHQRLRAPKSSFSLWPIGAIIVTAVFCAIVATLVLGLAGVSAIPIILCALLFSLSGVVLMTMLMFRPDDATLVKSIAIKEDRLDRSRALLAELEGRRKQQVDQIEAASAKRYQLLNSVKLQREQLLAQNWKAMRDIEWELFLARVFTSLGAEVETTSTVGDQGVDLVIEFPDNRIAVQAKGYHHAVSNSAVQQAVAGMRHYRCDSCAVITNSRFTKSARELASSNRCTLIGEDELPQLVLGKLSL